MAPVGSGLLRFVPASAHGFATGAAMAALFGGSMTAVNPRTLAGLAPFRYFWIVNEGSGPGNPVIIPEVAVRLKRHLNA